MACDLCGFEPCRCCVPPLLLHIPKNSRNGLELVAGEKIGILLGVLPEGGIQRKWDYNKLSLFEPNAFFAFTLTE